MPICVKGEIGKLNKVVLHRPGKELEHLAPDELEQLLSDGIPYLRAVQSKYGLLAGVLKEDRTEVVYLEDRMAEALEVDPAIKESFVEQLINESENMTQRFENQLYELPMDMPDEEQPVSKTMSGINIHKLKPVFSSPLVSLVKSDSHFVTNPIPSLHFTKDPLTYIGNGMSLNCMYSRIRRRETIFGKYILEHHSDHTGCTPFYYKREYLFSIGGDDTLSLSRRMLAVGVSQRIVSGAIGLLTQNIFEDEGCEVETILALDVPSIGAYMHLSTVCTQMDYDEFIIHPEILGSPYIYEIYRGDKSEPLHVTELDQPLSVVLATHLGLDKVIMIRCGDRNKIASGREQWNNESNILCTRPGRAAAYDRNCTTNSIPRDNGIEVLEMPSPELSEGKGGLRRMDIPLEWGEA